MGAMIRGFVLGLALCLTVGVCVSSPHSARAWPHGDSPPEFAIEGLAGNYRKTIHKGLLYVANLDQPSITAHRIEGAATGEVDRTLVGDDTQLSSPHGVAFDSHDRMYVANWFNDTVTVYSANAAGNTQPLAVLRDSISGGMGVNSIAIYQDHLYVVNTQAGPTCDDGAKGRINVYGLGWVNDGTSPSPITSMNCTHGIDHPMDIAFHSSGQTIVANYRASVTKHRVNWISTGDSTAIEKLDFATPYGIEVDMHDRLYVADYYEGRVSVFESTWTSSSLPLKQLFGPQSQIGLPSDLAIDTAGRLYVANPSGNKVLVYATSYQSIDFALPSDARFAVGDRVPVTANTTSGLDATLVTSTPEICSFVETNSSTLALHKRGRCTVSAQHSGSNQWNPATPVERSVTVATTPTKPTDAVATPEGSGTISLDWDSPADTGDADITGYRIQVRVGPDSWAELLKDTGSAATRHKISGLDNGTKYNFRIAAINRAGVSPNSKASASVAPATLPQPPTNLVAVADSGTVNLRWSAPTEDGGSAVSGYRIQVRIGTSAWATIERAAAGKRTSRTVTGLTDGRSYRFRVAAINDVGTSEFSSPSPDVIPGGVIEPDATRAPDTVGTTKIKMKRKRGRPHFYLRIRLPREEKAAPIDEYRLRMKVKKAKRTKKSRWSRWSTWRTTKVSESTTSVVRITLKKLNRLPAGSKVKMRVKSANSLGSSAKKTIRYRIRP